MKIGVNTVIFKDLVEILNALLTPIIAILAVYIAWQQYQIEHHSLRNQLYERRYVVFKAFMSFLADIMREGKTNYSRVGQFYAEASEADFLFTEAVGKKRDELHSKGVHMVYLHERMYPSDGSQGLPVGEERSKVAKENTDLLKWFYDQIGEIKNLFKSEMRVG